jgi:TPR repeat protein
LFVHVVYGEIMKSLVWLFALTVTACASSSQISSQTNMKPAQSDTEPGPECQALDILNGSCLVRAAYRVTEADYAGAEAMLDEICEPFSTKAVCSDAIDRMLSPSDVLFNPSRALSYLDRDCRGFGRRLDACLRAASIQMNGVSASYSLGYDAPFDWQGWGVRPDPEMAVGSFARACDLGDVEACRQAALEYASGRHVRRDPERAYQLYRQLCFEGSSNACDEAYKLRVFE